MEKLRARLVHKVTALREGTSRPVPAERSSRATSSSCSAGSLIPRGLGGSSKPRTSSSAGPCPHRETFPVEKVLGDADSQAGLRAARTASSWAQVCAAARPIRPIVVTGAGTAYGQIAEPALPAVAGETEFERGIRRFGLMLSEVMVALVLVPFSA